MNKSQEQAFHRRGNKMENKYMKRYSIFLKPVQIKNPNRQKSRSPKFTKCQGREVPSWWEYKMVKTFGKPFDITLQSWKHAYPGHQQLYPWSRKLGISWCGKAGHIDLLAFRVDGWPGSLVHRLMVSSGSNQPCLLLISVCQQIEFSVCTTILSSAHNIFIEY